jgi:hypothetical protein
MNINLIQFAVRLLVLCFLAVSNVAAVHAFPSFNAASDTQIEAHAFVSDAVVAETRSGVAAMGHCEQSTNSDFASNNQSSYSVSVCKVFCAAMSNVIANDLVSTCISAHVSPAIAFIAVKFHSPFPRLEKQPPRLLQAS